jgi:hypothetical protein
LDGAMQQARRAHLERGDVSVTVAARSPAQGLRVTKRDLATHGSVVAATVLVGLALAAVWAAIAPPAQVVLSQPPHFLPESDFHRFDDLAVFLMSGLVTGLLLGVALWLWRARRGPLVLVVAALGALLGGLVAVYAGPAIAATLYPAPGGSAGSPIGTVAPVLNFTTGTAGVRVAQWVGVLGVQPFGLVLAYLVLAVWNGMPDLGRNEGGRGRTSSEFRHDPVDHDGEQAGRRAEQ